MTTLGRGDTTWIEPERGYLDQVISELAHDPEFVAEEMALALAEDIVRAMEESEISQSELARRMGVSRAYISRMLDAPPNLTLLSISKVALALGLTPKVQLRRPRLSRSFTDSATPETADDQPSPSADFVRAALAE